MSGPADWRLDGQGRAARRWRAVVVPHRGRDRPARSWHRCAAAVREAAGRFAPHARRARACRAAAAPTCASIPGAARAALAVRRARGPALGPRARRGTLRRADRWRCRAHRACTSRATGPSSTSANGSHCARRKPGEQRLSDWLGPVDVHLDRARVLGFEFLDVTARLEPGRRRVARRRERTDGGRHRGDPGRFHRRARHSASTCGGWSCSRRQPVPGAGPASPSRSSRPASHRGPRRGFHLAGATLRPAGRAGRPACRRACVSPAWRRNRRTSRSTAPAPGSPKARVRARASRSSSRAPTSRPHRARSTIAMSSTPSRRTRPPT